MIVGEVSSARAQLRDQAHDYGPRVWKRSADAVQECFVVHLATACLFQQVLELDVFAAGWTPHKPALLPY